MYSPIADIAPTKNLVLGASSSIADTVVPGYANFSCSSIPRSLAFVVIAMRSSRFCMSEIPPSVAACHTPSDIADAVYTLSTPLEIVIFPSAPSKGIRSAIVSV